MIRKLFRSAACAAAICLLFAGCSAGKTSSGTGKFTVAVSIVPEATFAEAVCGNCADVVTLIPPGSSPETYEMTPRAMEEFSASQVYFAIGVESEDSAILPKKPDGLKVVRLQDAVSQAYTDLTFESGGRDPHIWLSPKRAKVMVQTIASQMAELDPANAETYAANAAAYEKRLDALDAQVGETLSGVKNRVFIVFHPAFGYFADDYGLKMVALEQEGKESTAEHVQELVDLAKQDGAKAIFYQAETDSKQATAFAEEIGGKTVELAPLSGDYGNNLLKMASVIADTVRSEEG